MKFEVPSFKDSKVCHPTHDIYYMHTKFGNSRFSRSIWRYGCGHRNWKWVMWTWPRPS